MTVIELISFFLYISLTMYMVARKYIDKDFLSSKESVDIPFIDIITLFVWCISSFAVLINLCVFISENNFLNTKVL